jgi:diamine N-acetyltransferase
MVMKLRNLKFEDKDGMLEWMKDEDLSSFFRFDANKTNEQTVMSFIEKSMSDEKNKHLAITNGNDEYLGTISLKNLDYKNSIAEYAISLRKKAIGSDIAKRATDTLLYIAFFELGLHKVYLNVISSNIRAVRFYEKYGFKYEGEFEEHVIIQGRYENLKWYGLLKKRFIELTKQEINTIPLRYDQSMFHNNN